MANCPNCATAYKKGGFGGFGGNLKLTREAIDFIHTFTNNTAEAYCETCAKDAIPIAKSNAQLRSKKFEAALNNNIHYVPLLSIQAPPGWKFTPLGLVTGQSVTGTGVFAEFASSWTDFFGMQSKSYNRKIEGGEIICQTQLRLKCVEMGGNAILGTDIDYAEVGGGKGMLMVCMTGTAVLLENTEVIGDEAVEAINTVTETAKNRRAIRRFERLMNAPIVSGITTSEGIE